MRANYIALDRADIQHAVKELCRSMSDPDEASYNKIVRLGRSLLGNPRAVSRFLYQEPIATQHVYTDANWAGCKSSRKSTSGGVVMSGAPMRAILVKDAEYDSAKQCGIRITSSRKSCAGQDLGLNVKTRLHIDAPVALGIIERRGVGRVRHSDVQ